MGLKPVVRAVEYLKDFTSDVIDRFRTGAINGAEAQLLIWDEIQKAVGSVSPKAYDDVLWLRIKTDHNDPDRIREVVEVLGRFSEVFSARYVGPRAGEQAGDAAGDEESPGVLYVATEVSGIVKAYEVVDCLTNEGYNIRDWTFGCHRR